MNLFSKSITLILGFTLSVLILGIYKGEAQHQGVVVSAFQERERTIIKKTDFDPPVKIKAAKTKGHSVPLGEKFTDDDDWLKGFSLLLHNNSQKTINHIGVELLFRPSPGMKDVPAGWMMEYGPNPFYYKTTEAIPTSPLPTVLAGGDLEIKLTDAEFEDLTNFLRRAGFPSQIHSVEVRVTSIGFSDGTAWYGGNMVKRDAGGRWTIAHSDRGVLHHAQARDKSLREHNPTFFDQFNCSRCPISSNPIVGNVHASSNSAG
jgi:hypothetical protein